MTHNCDRRSASDIQVDLRFFLQDSVYTASVVSSELPLILYILFFSSSFEIFFLSSNI